MKLTVFLFCHKSHLTIKDVLISLSLQSFKNFKLVVLADNVDKLTTSILTNEIFVKSLNFEDLIIENHCFNGKSNANIFGIENYPSDVIVWCDDDNCFDYDYLKAINLLFSSQKDLGVVGPGVVRAVDLYRKPLEEKYKSFFQEKCLLEHFYIGGPQYGFENIPAGTGMAFRYEIGLMGVNLINQGIWGKHDRIGLKMTSGNDTQFSYLAFLNGYKIGLSGLLKLDHLTTPAKLKYSYLRKMYFAVNSCHIAHVEALPNLKNVFENRIIKSTYNLIIEHLVLYHFRSLRLGKLKHLIKNLAERRGINLLNNKKDYFLDFIIYLMRLE